jgi:hypothetical protein
MPDYGPTGGPGGGSLTKWRRQEWKLARSLSDNGTRRNVIAAFQVVWRTPSGALQDGEPHGSFEVDGGAKQRLITLGAGEFIVEVQGEYGQFLDSLQVETSSGKLYGPFGGHATNSHATNSYEFPPVREPRQEIFGFSAERAN